MENKAMQSKTKKKGGRDFPTNKGCYTKILVLFFDIDKVKVLT